jgi:carboxylate-amine ligase
VRALVETAARDARAGRPVPPLRSEVLRLAAWRAERSGITGDLVHPLRGTPAPAADVVADLLDHVRAALADAGDERRVTDGVAAILRRGTGAQRQRAVHAATGDLAAVVRACASATVEPAGDATPPRDGG